MRDNSVYFLMYNMVSTLNCFWEKCTKIMNVDNLHKNIDSVQRGIINYPIFLYCIKQKIL